MAKNFGEVERNVNKLFAIGESFNFKGSSYKIIKSGKPTCPLGEPKTDAYVFAENIENSKKKLELKISVKKSNAEFMENKMSAERAEIIFGTKWQEIIRILIDKIKKNFEKEPLIYFKAANKTERGAIKLGWKFETFKTLQGKLSRELDKEYFREVLSGENLPEDKKNSSVNGVKIVDSGVADYMLDLPEITNSLNMQNMIDSLESVEDYANRHDYFYGCKALNYRIFKESPGQKWDGNRPLAVYVDWSIKNGKLCSKLVMDKPLQKRGNEIGNNLAGLLKRLKITKDNFDTLLDKVEDKSICYY